MATLENMLRWVVIACAFALPFVVFIISNSLFFPFITGKNFTFRIVVEIMAGAWLSLALVYPKYRPTRSLILGVFTAFVALIALSDVLGVHPFKSFWSNYERMDGWITLAHLALYLFAAVSVLNTENLWRRLWQTSIGISATLSVYGLLQLAGILAFGQKTGTGLAARVDATFGNPIYLAVYMLFHIFMASLLWAQAWRERAPGKRAMISWWYGSVIVLDTIVLFFTGTRGAMLGLIGGALSAIVLYAFVAGGARIRGLAVGSLVGVALLGGALWSARDTSLVKSVGFLDRLASISLSDATVKARFINWSIAWQGVKERPVFGWGQENYAIVFDKYYDPRMYEQEPWFDRVHNIVFDWWIAGGTLGLFAYLSIFAAALWTLWRSQAFSVGEKSILTGLLAGYFTHNFFVFDNVTSYIAFGMLVGYIVWHTRGSGGTFLEDVRIPEGALPVVAACIVVLTWGGAWYANAGALAQNRALLSSLEPQEGGLKKNLELLQKSIAYGSFGTQEAREQLAQIASRVATIDADLPTKQAFFEAGTREMALQADASPLDARFPLFLGLLFNSYGDYADAMPALERARALSPKKQSIILQMAATAEALGDTGRSIALFKEAYELDTSFAGVRVLYAAALVRAARDAEADMILAPIISSGEAANQQLLAAYMARTQYGKISTIWEAYVKTHPADAQGFLTLASAYYASGDSEKAVATLRRIDARDAATKAQVEQLIQEVRSGTAQLL